MNEKINKTYLCYFEGSQEERYFRHFSKLVKSQFENVTIKFKKVEKLKILQNSSTQIPKVAIFDYDNNKRILKKK